jgi:hypothetical protein
VLELSVSRRLFGVAVRLCWNIPSVDGFFHDRWPEDRSPKDPLA